MGEERGTGGSLLGHGTEIEGNATALCPYSVHLGMGRQLRATLCPEARKVSRTCCSAGHMARGAALVAVAAARSDGVAAQQHGAKSHVVDSMCVLCSLNKRVVAFKQVVAATAFIQMGR